MRIRMKRSAPHFDWNHARAFLATAREGSLSAAARVLGQTQPTIGRQIAALEAELGVTLFERSGRTPVLTAAGVELAEHVVGMADAAELVSLSASGQSQAVEGQVCITASDSMAAWHLPAVVERLRLLAPGIEIEIMASNSIQDLRRREADIAVRHLRPEQPDLITRLVHTSTAHMYATPDYLQRAGRPRALEDLATHDFIGYEGSDRMLPVLNAMGVPVTRDNFRLVSNSGLVVWELTRRGLGIGIHTTEIARMTPDVEAVLPEALGIPVPFWLTTHRELHTARRIRLVFDLLAEAFGALADRTPAST